MGGFAEFDAYIRARAHEYVEELKALIRQPTVSAQGIGVEDTATLVLERARRAGIGAEALRADGGPPTIVGETGRGARTLLVYNHYDVQPPDPLDEWETPPFEPTERGGLLFGRGVSDNKGNLMARLPASWMRCAIPARPSSRTSSACRSTRPACCASTGSRTLSVTCTVRSSKESTSSSRRARSAASCPDTPGPARRPSSPRWPARRSTFALSLTSRPRRSRGSCAPISTGEASVTSRSSQATASGHLAGRPTRPSRAPRSPRAERRTASIR